MQKLSTGDDATLGNYRKLSAAFLGADSPAVKFLDDKITESANGENEEVIALHLLLSFAEVNKLA